MQAAPLDGAYPIWRWDQGRLEYLRVENVPRLSASLCNVSGLNVTSDDPEIRRQFYAATELQFRPTSYTLWRNYGRVFKLLLLAQAVDDQVQASSLAKTIHAAGPKQLDSDRYLENIFALARFPHPAFQDYRAVARPTRPFIAVIRALLLNDRFGRGISAEDVCVYLIASQCRGDENDRFFATMAPGSPSSAELTRQVRELLKFASQHSCLTWIRSRLVPATRSGLESLLSRLTDIRTPGMSPSAEEEFLELARMAVGSRSKDPWTPRTKGPADADEPTGITFLEGDRRLVQHSRLERNRRLRKYVIKRAAATVGDENLECNCCGLVPRSKYSWSDSSLLEVHHLLPLSSPARPNATGTEFAGVVLICPTCHRAVHSRYRIYLAERKIDDFASEQEAVALYNQVREDILKSGPNHPP